MRLGMASAVGVLVLLAGLSSAQSGTSKGPWTGTITATIKASEPGYKSVGTMNCTVSGTSARCTYTSTAEASGKDAYTITESATQDHLQVSVVQGKGEWTLRVAAFISKGTKSLTAKGKTMTGSDIYIQAPNWEVPIASPRDPNKLFGTWKNPLGDEIQYDLSR